MNEDEAMGQDVWDSLMGEGAASQQEWPEIDPALFDVVSELLSDEETAASDSSEDDPEMARLEEWVHRLPPHYAHYIRLRFGLVDGVPLTIGEAAAECCLTRERVRALEHTARLRMEAKREAQLGYTCASS